MIFDYFGRQLYGPKVQDIFYFFIITTHSLDTLIFSFGHLSLRLQEYYCFNTSSTLHLTKQRKKENHEKSGNRAYSETLLKDFSFCQNMSEEETFE